jgi:hypothetical protein
MALSVLHHVDLPLSVRTGRQLFARFPFA